MDKKCSKEWVKASEDLVVQLSKSALPKPWTHVHSHGSQMCAIPPGGWSLCMETPSPPSDTGRRLSLAPQDVSGFCWITYNCSKATFLNIIHAGLPHWLFCLAGCPTDNSSLNLVFAHHTHTCILESCVTCMLMTTQTHSSFVCIQSLPSASISFPHLATVHNSYPFLKAQVQTSSISVPF